MLRAGRGLATLASAARRAGAVEELLTPGAALRPRILPAPCAASARPSLLPRGSLFSTNACERDAPGRGRASAEKLFPLATIPSIPNLVLGGGGGEGSGLWGYPCLRRLFPVPLALSNGSQCARRRGRGGGQKSRETSRTPAERGRGGGAPTFSPVPGEKEGESAGFRPIGTRGAEWSRWLFPKGSRQTERTPPLLPPIQTLSRQSEPDAAISIARVRPPPPQHTQPYGRRSHPAYPASLHYPLWHLSNQPSLSAPSLHACSWQW